MILGQCRQCRERRRILLQAFRQPAIADQFQTEIHQQVGLARQFFNGQMQQTQVARDLVAALHHLLRVTVVQQLGVAKPVLKTPLLPAHFHAGENLLVNPPDVEEPRRIAEQSRHMAHAFFLTTFINHGQTPRDG